MLKSQPLTGLQKTMLSSGRKLAKELGLFRVNLTPFTHGLTFTEGQTALVASPSGISAGTIKVEVEEYGDLRNTTAVMNDAFYFRKQERLIEGSWVLVHAPDLFMPTGAKLYVS
jgi:hypothetical protein